MLVRRPETKDGILVVTISAGSCAPQGAVHENAAPLNDSCFVRPSLRPRAGSGMASSSRHVSERLHVPSCIWFDLSLARPTGLNRHLRTRALTVAQESPNVLSPVKCNRTAWSLCLH
ncbi:hypothetical protein MVEN_00913800 [Mycena venus]|uniref:Uncharacterized protein n=1 Tax=Mycena venus TaxID=2733690 RepID=A0A8H6YCC7_9AGAR|nr:hypothetical protein MVEN_00913800 [Mycena venus]